MFKILNSIYWSEEITRDINYRMYNTIVKSFLTYGCEAWNHRIREKRNCGGENGCIEKESCGISRRDRIITKEDKRKMKIIETVEGEIERRPLIKMDM